MYQHNESENAPIRSIRFFALCFDITTLVIMSHMSRVGAGGSSRESASSLMRAMIRRQYLARNTVSREENGFNGEYSKEIKGFAKLRGACFAKLGRVCFAKQDCAIAVQWQ